jgi:hypothetical protein
LLAPPQAIVAGRFYLLADGKQMGTYTAFSLEQVSLFFGAFFTVLAAGLMVGSYWQTVFSGGTPRLATYVGLPLVALSIVALLVGSTLPLCVDLGFNAFHSDVLLPLNVAAYCNHLNVKKKKKAQVAESVKSLVFSIALLRPVDGLGNRLASLEDALANIALFLNKMGLPVESLSLDDGEDEAAARSSATIFVFVLPSVTAAEAWRDRWAPSMSTSRMVLVVTKEVMERCAYCRELMLIIVGEHNGLSETSAYASEGFAVALIDALGAKVGAAFLERERESRKLGFEERMGAMGRGGVEARRSGRGGVANFPGSA